MTITCANESNAQMFSHQIFRSVKNVTFGCDRISILQYCSMNSLTNDYRYRVFGKLIFLFCGIGFVPHVFSLCNQPTSPLYFAMRHTFFGFDCASELQFLQILQVYELDCCIQNICLNQWVDHHLIHMYTCILLPFFRVFGATGYLHGCLLHISHF